MTGTDSVGPDVVICGAARAGTSFLASLLSRHPEVDPGAVKEPNFFSREYGLGTGWYDGLYRPRREGLLRLDASATYTYPQFSGALINLARHAPDAFVIYAVREPVERMLSHYHLRRNYFRNEPAETFGDALTGNEEVYRGTSDYARWLGALRGLFPEQRVLVVPFGVVTKRTEELIDVVCGLADLDPTIINAQDPASQQHRNEVVEFRHESFRRARRFVHRSGAYPWLRESLGKDRLRRVRARLTRNIASEDLDEALISCGYQQLVELRNSYTSAHEAVAEGLAGQDHRLGLDWSAVWLSECPSGGSDAVQRRLEVIE